jgi:tRNA A37 threonylcarbamoyladenosine dehydratase
MMDQFARTRLLYGADAMDVLASSRVAVFGIGGVGGYVVEGLARSGIGALDLIDDDKVCLTNINRQIIATKKTIGKYKVDVAKERVLDISPRCDVRTYKTFYLPGTQDQFDFTEYDYIVDAIDTVTGKLTIIENAKKAGVPVISSMGAGNKTDASAFEVADIYETSICPLAKVMRRECRKRGIESLKVVYSKEVPVRPIEDMSISCRQNCVCPPGTERKCTDRRDIPGSTAFVPSVAGLIIAGEIVNDLTHRRQDVLSD